MTSKWYAVALAACLCLTSVLHGAEGSALKPTQIPGASGCEAR